MEQAHSTVTRLQDWLVRQGVAAETRKAGLRHDVVDLPFGRISYLRSAGPVGAGTPVLMLHGAASDNTAWIRCARELKAGLPLLIPDLPGHGKSSSDPALSYGIAAQAERVAQFLAVLNVKRVHVVGNSMGGAIALHLAARFPALVSSLVLVGAMGVHAKESWLERRIAETGHNPMVRVRDKAEYLAMLRIGMHKPPFMPGFVHASLARAYAARAAINLKVAQDIAADLDQSERLAQVRCPALLVWGREDRVSDVANAERLHGLLGTSSLAILDGIGHVPMVEAPGVVASLCREFLAEPVVQTQAGAAAG